jgi:cyclopropane fatty-acyl-phospholipid synthase-like methyltransferase
MKHSIEDHADRFDEWAGEYDAEQSAEYRAAVSLVVEHADPAPDETVLDVGAGTGAIALALAPETSRVLGRDISDGMLTEAREKATERGLDDVSFAEGRFREPNLPADAAVDVVTSNFAMHHLDDEAKREAIATLSELAPRRVVLGDVMFFGQPDPEEPFYSPEVDDPATVGVLADAFTDAGYALTAVEMVHEQVGVLVADRLDGDRVLDTDRLDGGRRDGHEEHE